MESGKPLPPDFLPLLEHPAFPLQVLIHQSLRPCWSPSSLPPPHQDTGSLKCVNAWGRAPVGSSSSQPLTGGMWSWSWRFGTGSPGRPSSTATPGRAQAPGLRVVKENAGVGSQPTQGDPQLPPSPTSLNPASPRQDTDDDRHSRRHLPNLFVRLHDLLDPRLERRQRGRTSSPQSQNGVQERERGVSREKGGGGQQRTEGIEGGGASGSRSSAMRPPSSPAWARASRELGPLLSGPATCSPAGTARCTSFSCSASPGLSRRAGPSAAACSLPAPGPARRPPVEVPPGPGAVRSAPAAPHGVLAPPVGSCSQGPSARPSEPPGLCASVRDPTATPARPQARRANVSPAPPQTRPSWVP